MVRLQGTASWITFRDARNRGEWTICYCEERPEMLGSPDAALGEARRISEESARILGN